MKKYISLFLTLVLILSFSACGGKSPTDTEGTTVSGEDTDTTKILPVIKETSFEDATYNLSVALTIGLRYTLDKNALDYPSALWDIFGWLCAYSAKNGGKDYLTESQISALQYAVRPGKQPLSVPDGWESSGAITMERTEKGYNYYFPNHTSNFEEYFGSLNFDITKEDESTVKVVLTDSNYEEINEEFTYIFSKDEKAGADFPYVLSDFEIPEYKVAEEYGEDTFTYEDVVQANLITNLLKNHNSVKYDNYMSSGVCESSVYFTRRDVICRASNSLNGAGEGMEISGSYGNMQIYDSGDHYTYYAYQNAAYAGTDDYQNDYGIAGLMEYGTICDVESTDNGFLFSIDSGYEDEYPTEVTYLVDKSTLELKEMTHYVDGEEYFRFVFSYDEPVDDYGIFDEFDGKWREITVCEEFYDSEGNVANGAFTVEMPSNVEYYPIYDQETAIYTNSDMTGEYNYPGNGIDYQIYVTNAMG